MWTDDPVSDFNRWDAAQERKLSRMPICSECGEHIQDDRAYYINGEWVCRECMSLYLREVLPE